MATYKNLSCPNYWRDFGRGAIGAAFLPSPQEASETILGLIEKVEKIEAELNQTKANARKAIQPLEAISLQLENGLSEARHKMRSALND